MFSALFHFRSRWLSVVWTLTFVLSCQLVFTSCNPAKLKTEAASVSQIVLSTLQDPKTFNPTFNQEFPNIFLFAFDGLVRENGVTGAIEPALAESWQFSVDKKRIVFTLRDRLQWSDGEPLTADDVVFTFRDVIFNKKVPTDFKDGLKIGVKGAFPQVNKLDERRVEFILPERFAPFLPTIAMPDGISILPQHILGESLKSLDSQGNPLFVSTWATDTDPAKIIVNGAYKIESYIAGQRLIFRRNPYYWRKDDQGNQLPYIERIIWEFVENTDTQLLKFRSTDLDVMGDARPLRPEYFSLLKREEKRGNFKVYNGGPWSGTTYITFNLNKARNDKNQPIVDPIKSRWFNNLAFRQAVAYAINRERILTNIFRGIGVVQNSPISVQSPYYQKEGLKVYNYVPNKSKELLLKAGFKYDSRGQLLDNEGNRVRFTLLTNAGNKVREGMGAQIQEDLGKIGIKVDFNAINFGVLVDKTSTTRDWDCHLIGFTGGIEPHSGANLWTSRGGSHTFNLAPQPGQPPITGWEASEWEQEIDRLFTAGTQEVDENKRKAIYGKFQQIVQEQLPVIHLVNDQALMAVRDRVQGLKYSGLPSWGLWNIPELKIVED
ncbi:ABC transporter substrate-binding protein [Iningainema tapete]|uniref:ABC transporter substrate-binding protein n=1 Tax=Iningainema tapete BLCC-T55 TaxID=2748662 RepID=A0A8J7BX18_9CYAN|nr:ABC transporter substrate-binding protein [Iningainema tapete]MBD2772847.1 ABC transporter substrate-binding protein [Iningainema tapete BLCC-T55]